MPRMNGSFLVDPTGVSTSVSITVGGIAATTYTTEAGSVAHSAPAVISAPTRFWVENTGSYRVVSSRNGVTVDDRVVEATAWGGTSAAVQVDLASAEAAAAASTGIRKAAAGDDVFSAGVVADVADRLQVDADGSMYSGDGTVAPIIHLDTTPAVGVVSIGKATGATFVSVDSSAFAGGLWVGNMALGRYGNFGYQSNAASFFGGSNRILISSSGGYPIEITGAGTAVVGSGGAITALVAKGGASQTADIFRCVTTADAEVFGVTKEGALRLTAAGTYAGATAAGGVISFGTGAPVNASGVNGDIYLRVDGGALSTMYQRRAGAWVGIV